MTMYTVVGVISSLLMLLPGALGGGGGKRNSVFGTGLGGCGLTIESSGAGARSGLGDWGIESSGAVAFACEESCVKGGGALPNGGDGALQYAGVQDLYMTHAGINAHPPVHKHVGRL